MWSYIYTAIIISLCIFIHHLCLHRSLPFPADLVRPALSRPPRGDPPRALEGGGQDVVADFVADVDLCTQITNCKTDDFLNVSLLYLGSGRCCSHLPPDGLFSRRPAGPLRRRVNLVRNFDLKKYLRYINNSTVCFLLKNQPAKLRSRPHCPPVP